MRHIKRAARKLLNRYPRFVLRQEFESQAFTRFNERPIEIGFVFRKVGEIYPRSILDVGTGTTALPQVLRDCGCLVTATDNVLDYWPDGMVNRHYHVIDDNIKATRQTGTFDLVTCISVLEHIHGPDDAVKSMFSLLKSKGHLILTFPYTEKGYMGNVYELPGSSYGKGLPYVAQSYSRSDLERWLTANDGTIVDQEYWQFWEGDHWTVGKQVIPPLKVGAGDKHQLTCLLIRRG